MNMKKAIFAMVSALAAMVGASPASATIYQYTMVSTNIGRAADVLTINTATKSATFKGGYIDASFTSNELANFTGGAFANFSGVFTSFSGTFDSGALVNTTLNNIGRGVPKFEFLPISGSEERFYIRGIQWTTLNTDVSWQVSSFTVLPDPVNVPEPAMLGLFGAGAVMVMMGRRRRSVGKAQGSARLATA